MASKNTFVQTASLSTARSSLATLGLIVFGVCSAIVTGYVADAHPYASGVTNDLGTIRFIMNESGATVNVVFEDNSGFSMGVLPKGGTNFSLGAHTSFRIICFKTGNGTPSLISSNAFTNSIWNSVRGVDVNKNPKLGNLFGRMYVGNSAGGTNPPTANFKGLGLYALNADQTEALGKGTNATATTIWLGNAGGNAIIGSSPWRLRIAPDNSVLVVDSTVAGAALWQFTPDLSSSNLVLGTVGLAAGVAAGIHGDMFGTPLMTGSLANSNLVLWTADSGMGAQAAGNTNCVLGPGTSPNSFNCLFRYDIGAGPLPWNKGPNYAYSMGVDGISDLRTEVELGKDGKIIGGFGRANGSNPNIQILNPAGTSVLYTSWLTIGTAGPGGTAPFDPWAGINGSGIATAATYAGIRVSPDGKYLASVDINNGITLAALTNGIPDDGSISGIANGPNGVNARGMCWDAADNIWVCSSGQALLRCYSLGMTTTCITSNDFSGTNGSFELVLPPVAASVAATTPTASQNYINNLTPGTPIPGVFTISLSTNDLTFNGPVTASFVRNGSAAFPANYTMNLGTNVDGVIINSNSVTFPGGLWPHSNGVWSADVQLTPTAVPLSGPTLTVGLRLISGANYSVGTPVNGTVAILNTGPQLLTLSSAGSGSSMSRGVPGDSAKFVITRTGDTNGPGNSAGSVTPTAYTVTNFNYFGSASYPLDYTAGAQRLDPTGNGVAAAPTNGIPGIVIYPGQVTMTGEIGNPVKHTDPNVPPADLTVVLNLTNRVATPGNTNAVSLQNTPYLVTTSQVTLNELDNTVGGEVVLWSNPLTNSADSVNWTAVFANTAFSTNPVLPAVIPNYANSNLNPTNDFSVTFGKAVASDGIPQSTAMAANGWNKALKMTVNKTVGAEAGVNLYPQGQNFQGNYALRFDMYLSLNELAINNPNIGTSAREFAAFGINHTGTNCNWRLDSNPRPAGTGSSPTNADGVWFAIDASAGSVTPADFDMFTSPALPNSGVQADQINSTAGLESGVFKHPPFASINSTGGEPVNQWVDVSVEVRSQTNVSLLMARQQIVSFSLTNTVTSGQYINGTPMLGYLDPNRDIGGSNSFVYYSNVRVVELSPYIQTQAVSLIITQGGNASFTSSAILGTAPVTNTWYQGTTNGPGLPPNTAGTPTFAVQTASANATGITNTLSLSNVQSGTNFMPVFSDIAGSVTGLVRVLEVIQGPTNATVSVTSNFVFKITPTGNAPPLSFQWKFGGTNLVNGPHYSGVTSNSLTISNLTVSDAGVYSNAVVNANGTVVPSATLTIGSVPPSIVTVSPTSQTNVAGATATFSANADGTVPLTYRWLFNGTNLTDNARVNGSQTLNLAISSTTSADSGPYQVVVTNLYGAVTSAVASLTVLDPPLITTQPSSQITNVGATVSFSVSATGVAPLSYQWLFNGTPLSDSAHISGSQSSAITISSVQDADAGAYSVVVSNAAGTVSSLAAALTFTLPYTWITIAGSAGNPGSTDGTNNSARFHFPAAAKIDNSGNLFVPDPFNFVIRKLTRVGPNWVVTTIAGLAGSSGGDDGANSQARFIDPEAIAIDSAGNLYVGDVGNSAIRRISPVGTNWIVTTIAGGTYGSLDGTNGAAQFGYPGGIAVDPSNNVFVADSDFSTIRKITHVGLDWVVTTIAGSPGVTGTNDGNGNLARFNSAVDVAADPAGNLFVADTSSHTIRKITLAGTNWVVSTIAGSPHNLGSSDGTGGAARFNFPLGIAADNAGRLYVSDSANDTIREIAPAGANWVVTTIGGLAPVPGSADGNGASARFDAPEGLVVDAAGDVYVADNNNHTIREGLPDLGPPAIVAQPQGQVAVAGTNTTFNVLAVGAQPLSYQWQLNGTNLTDSVHISGSQSASLAISTVLISDGGNYQVIVTNTLGVVTSSVAALTVTAPAPPAFTSAIFLTNGFCVLAFTSPNGQNATLQAASTLAGPWSDLGPLPGSPYSISVTGSERYFRIYLPDFGIYSINQAGYVVVTALVGTNSVFNPFLGVTLDNAMPSPPDTTEAFLTNNLDFNYAYYYDAGTPGWLDESFFNPAGSTNIPPGAIFMLLAPQVFQFTLAGIVAPGASNQPPMVTVQPQNRSRMVGTTATFSVVALGTAPLSYQWLFYGTNLSDTSHISGSQSANLTVSNVQTGDAGDYQVIVSNPFGYATSSLASLTVTPFGQVFRETFDTTSTPNGVSPPLWFGPVITNQSVTFVDGAGVGGSRAVVLAADFPVAYSGWLGANEFQGPSVAGNISTNLADYTLSFDISVTGVGLDFIALNVQGWAGNGYTGAFGESGLGAVPIGPITGFQHFSVNLGDPTIWPTNTLNPASGTMQLQFQIGGYPSGYGFTGGGPAIGEVVVLDNLALNLNPPSITVQPQSQIAVIGSAVNFAATATGNQLSYQWRKNGTIISGATNSNYPIASAQMTDAADYSVLVSNVVQIVTSSTGTLSVVSIPDSRNMAVGGRVSVVSIATGTGPFTYQWSQNSTPIGGATGNSLVLTNLQVSDSGNYAVAVANAAGSVSPSATLSVTSGNIRLYDTNLVVIRAGEGTQPLSVNGNSVFLDQYTPAGVCVNTVSVPDTGPTGVVLSGGSFVQGYLSRSLDGRLLTFAAYGTNVGSGVNVTTSTNVPRVVAAFNGLSVYSQPVLGTSGYAGQAWRSAATDGTNNFWGAASAGGTLYLGNASPPSVVQNAKGNTRVVEVFNGSLYMASAAFNIADNLTGIYKFNGLPTTNVGLPVPIVFTNTFNTNTLTGINDFAINPSNTILYFADDRNFNNLEGGLQRWDFDNVNDIWTNSYHITNGLAVGLSHLVVDWTGPNPVIFATTAATTQNQLVSVADLGPASVFTALASTGTNQVFKGIKFGPISDPPTIIAQPQSRTNGINTTATFSVSAVGTAPLTYQWQFNSVNRSGATNASLSVPNAHVADAGNYRVIVSNPYGTVTSSVASLAVITAPVIFVQPMNAQVTAGSSVDFSVVASSSGPLNYQWFHDSVAIPGATNATYSLSNAQLSDNGNYYVQVSNLAGSVASSTAGLLVQQSSTPPPVTTSYTLSLPPGTNLFACQVIIGGNTLHEILPVVPEGTIVSKYDNASGTWAINTFSTAAGGAWIPSSITLSPGEGAFIQSTGSVSLTFTGTPHVPVLPVVIPNGVAWLLSRQTNDIGAYSNIVGSLPSVGAAVYKWNRTNSTYTAYTFNGTSWTGGTEPTAAAGEPMWIAPNGGAPVSIPEPPTITQQPVSISVAQGSLASFTVMATGTAPLSYQWRLNGNTIPGATSNVFTIPNAQPTNAGNYSAVVANSIGIANSAVASLTISNLAPLPATDNFANAGDLGSVTNGTFGGSNAGATIEPGEPIPNLLNLDLVPPGASVWLRWHPLVSGLATFTTAGSDFDTILAVYTGSTISNLVSVAADDDSAPSLCSLLSFNAVAGTTYFIQIQGYNRTAGNIVFSWNLAETPNPDPEILVQPLTQTAIAGTDITLFVVVTNAGPSPSYQWYSNFVALAGETASNLTLHPAQPGLYIVAVTNTLTQVGVLSMGADIETIVFDSGQVGPPTTVHGEDKLVTEAALTPPDPNVPHDPSTASSFTGTQGFTTVGTTADPTEPSHCNYRPCKTKWYSYTPPSDSSGGLLNVTLIGTNGFNGILEVYDGDPSSYATLRSLGCSANHGSAGEHVSLAATLGTTYWIVVDGVDCNAGGGTIYYTLNSSPAFALMPVSQTWANGSRVSLTASAVGATPIGYQWRFNGNKIQGATTASYVIPSLGKDNQGAYTVITTNMFATNESIPALIYVSDPAHFISTVNSGGVLALQLAGKVNSNYVLEASSDLVRWTPIKTNNSPFGIINYTDPINPKSVRFYRSSKGK